MALCILVGNWWDQGMYFVRSLSDSEKLAISRPWERGWRAETNFSPTMIQRRFWTLSALGSLHPHMTKVLHFWSDLTIVKVGDNKRSQVLTRAEQEADHFDCILSNGSRERAHARACVWERFYSDYIFIVFLLEKIVPKSWCWNGKEPSKIPCSYFLLKFTIFRLTSIILKKKKKDRNS